MKGVFSRHHIIAAPLLQRSSQAGECVNGAVVDILIKKWPGPTGGEQTDRSGVRTRPYKRAA
jgi:hypothetical protein